MVYGWETNDDDVKQRKESLIDLGTIYRTIGESDDGEPNDWFGLQKDWFNLLWLKQMPKKLSQVVRLKFGAEAFKQFCYLGLADVWSFAEVEECDENTAIIETCIGDLWHIQELRFEKSISNRGSDESDWIEFFNIVKRCLPHLHMSKNAFTDYYKAMAELPSCRDKQPFVITLDTYADVNDIKVFAVDKNNQKGVHVATLKYERSK